jgi:hypothetical protein
MFVAIHFAGTFINLILTPLALRPLSETFENYRPIEFMFAEPAEYMINSVSPFSREERAVPIALRKI